MSTETAGTDETPQPPTEVVSSTEPPPSGGGIRPAARRGSDPVIAAGRGWRRRLIEAVLVSAVSLAVAVYMTWPMMKTVGTTVPGEPGDPLYFAWQLAWVAHSLAHHPFDLSTTPAFMGADGNLFFTDTIFGYAPLGLFTGADMTGGLRMLNIATFLTFALAGVGAYALARALGSRVPGAIVAGAGFAYAPWRMEQIVHLNILSTGGMALALAFLVRGHGWSLRYGLRPHTRSTGFVVAGWAVATWQITLGFGLGVVFGYMLGGTVALLALGWLSRARYRQWLTRRFVITDIVGAVVFLAVAGLLTIPYTRVVADYPEAKRGPEWLPAFSPPWKGFLTAPDTNILWGERQKPWRKTLYWTHEMVVSPGIILALVAVAGILFSSWAMRRRLLVGLYTLVMTALAFGTAFPWWEGRYTFMIAYNHLPGWNSTRTPGRLIIWVTLGLCLLAAGFVSHLTDKVLALPRRGVLADVPCPPAPPAPRSAAEDAEERSLDVFGDDADDAFARGITPRPPRPHLARGPRWLGAALAVVLCLPAAAVVWEDRSRIPQWEIYRPPVPLAALPTPTFIWPTSQVIDYYFMLWQADGWPVIANGDSGFYPKFQVELQDKTKDFPDAASVAYLRAKGIKSVMIIQYQLDDDELDSLTKSLDGLDITREVVEDGVVYDLRPPQER